ncbi:MAG: hypothetical protein ACI83O_000102 [Patescibacteria group bacterium]|jgi:hypothetical protein
MRGWFNKQKKALSPIIATMLLIFLVLILASIVFLWARGFFTEQLEKSGTPVEQQCANVLLKVQLLSKIAISGKIELDLSNSGSVPLYGISIKEIGTNGNEVAKFHAVNIAERNGARSEFTLNSPLDSLEKIIVYPVLLAGVVGGTDNKEFTCLDEATILTL